MVKKADEPGLEDVKKFIKDACAVKNNIYLGIDPGLHGAIGMLCGNLYCVIDIPAFEVNRKRVIKVRQRKGEPKGSGPKTKTVKGKATKFDNPAIWEIFSQFLPCVDKVYVALEIGQATVGINRGSDVRTAFLTGGGYMMWPLFLYSHDFSLEEMEPNDWKVDFGLIKKDKEVSRAKAKAYWPKAPLSRKDDHNRAEALLLAECRRRRHGQDKSGNR